MFELRQRERIGTVTVLDLEEVEHRVQGFLKNNDEHASQLEAQLTKADSEGGIVVEAIREHFRGLREAWSQLKEALTASDLRMEGLLSSLKGRESDVPPLVILGVFEEDGAELIQIGAPLCQLLEEHGRGVGPLSLIARFRAKRDFTSLIDARLRGDQRRLVEAFSDQGWDLLRESSFPVEKIPGGDGKSLRQECGLIFEHGGIHAKKVADLIDVRSIRTLGLEAARRAFGNVEGISRVFQRGGMMERDVFVYADLNEMISPRSMLIGVEHSERKVFHVFRATPKGWKADYLIDR
jgi:hypothetical protein